AVDQESGPFPMGRVHLAQEANMVVPVEAEGGLCMAMEPGQRLPEPRLEARVFLGRGHELQQQEGGILELAVRDQLRHPQFPCLPEERQAVGLRFEQAGELVGEVDLQEEGAVLRVEAKRVIDTSSMYAQSLLDGQCAAPFPGEHAFEMADEGL